MSEPHNPYAGAMITDIRRGSSSKNRSHIIYARLVDANGELLISATLDYILDAIKSHLPPTP
jgi:hypothetical protein